jgi:hypothetical protein
MNYRHITVSALAVLAMGAGLASCTKGLSGREKTGVSAKWNFDVSHSRDVDRQEYTVATPGGELWEVVAEYRTTATYYVEETGSAGWPDSRRCLFHGRPSKIERRFLIPRRGKDALYSYKLFETGTAPDDINMPYKDCNDIVDAGRLNRLLNDELDRQDWQEAVKIDAPEVKRLLDTLGTVQLAAKK